MIDGDQGPGHDIPTEPPGSDMRVPAQVEVAFDILRWANAVQVPVRSFSENAVGRELTAKENSVYEAALEVLRLYLTGEMDFGQTGFDESMYPHPISAPQHPVKNVS